ADVLLEPRREGARKPSDPAAEVENAPASGGSAKLVAGRERRLHVCLSGREKPLELPAPTLEARRAENRPERIDRRELFPVPLVPAGHPTALGLRDAGLERAGDGLTDRLQLDPVEHVLEEAPHDEPLRLGPWQAARHQVEELLPV